MNDSFQYPQVHHFTPVLFATEPGAGQFQWTAGFVVCPKNNSCDIVVFHADGAIDYRSDCWHADDPRCKASMEYRQTGRGVFRIAVDEQEKRRAAEDVLRLRRDVRDMNMKLQRLQEAVDLLSTPAPTPPRRKEEALAR